MEKPSKKHVLLKLLVALLPTLIFLQNYSWMTANRMTGLAFVILFLAIVWTAWSFEDKNAVLERYFRLTEVGFFFLPLSALIMTFVLGAQAIGTSADGAAQAGAAIGTAIGGTLVIVLSFVIGIPAGIIMHLVSGNYAKKMDAGHGKQPETVGAKHGVVLSIGILFLLAIVLGAAGAASSQGKASLSAQQASQKSVAAEIPPKEEKPIIVSASDLYSAYISNELAADNQYKDRLLQVVGPIESIGNDMFGKPYLTLQTNDFLGSIRCELNEAGAVQAARVSKDAMVTIQGRSKGYGVAMVTLGDCKIAP